MTTLDRIQLYLDRGVTLPVADSKLLLAAVKAAQYHLDIGFQRIKSTPEHNYKSALEGLRKALDVLNKEEEPK